MAPTVSESSPKSRDAIGDDGGVPHIGDVAWQVVAPRDGDDGLALVRVVVRLAMRQDHAFAILVERPGDPSQLCQKTDPNGYRRSPSLVTWASERTGMPMVLERAA